MAVRADVKSWVVEALRPLEEGATSVELCKQVWRRHERELRDSGSLLFTWQVDVRRALVNLRQAGVEQQPPGAPPGTWSLRR